MKAVLWIELWPGAYTGEKLTFDLSQEFLDVPFTAPVWVPAPFRFPRAQARLGDNR